MRQQLAALGREGLIEVRVEKRKVGRPTHLYALSGKAESLFPQAYGPFALGLLRQIRDVDGEKKLEKMFERRTRSLIGAYRKRLQGMSVAEKWRELARIRADEGYMADSAGKGLSEHHCPIAAIAREFPLACRMEKKLFEAVLGAKLERTDHLASGGRACVYALAPKKKST